MPTTPPPPKADVVLITHSHYDHLDVAAVEAIQTPQTEILCDRTSAEAFEMNCYTMRPGSVATPRDYLKVEAVAAYNTTDGHLQFHPKEREGLRLRAHDRRLAHLHRGRYRTHARIEGAEEYRHRLPAGQPALHDDRRPGRRGRQGDPADDLLPYHYGEVEEKTDIDRLARELEGVTEVRIRPME